MYILYGWFSPGFDQLLRSYCLPYWVLLILHGGGGHRTIQRQKNIPLKKGETTDIANEVRKNLYLLLESFVSLPYLKDFFHPDVNHLTSPPPTDHENECNSSNKFKIFIIVAYNWQSDNNLDEIFLYQQMLSLNLLFFCK